MVNLITHIGRFLVVSDNDDGNQVSTYINIDNIISAEFGSSCVAILCVGDVEYEWSLNPAQIVAFKSELHKIFE